MTSTSTNTATKAMMVRADGTSINDSRPAASAGEAWNAANDAATQTRIENTSLMNPRNRLTSNDSPSTARIAMSAPFMTAASWVTDDQTFDAGLGGQP